MPPSDKLGHGRLLTVAFFIYAITYLGFAFVTEQSVMLLLCLVYGLYLGLSQGVLLPEFLTDTLSPAWHRFWYRQLCCWSCSSAGQFAHGHSYQHFGALAAFATCAAIALLSALILALQLPALAKCRQN